MKISGAIFDLDGTLLDSMFIWETIGEDYIKAKGFVPEDNLRDKLKNTSLKQAAEYLKYNYPLTESIDKIVDEVNVMTEDFYINKGQLKDGAKELLYFFKNKGVKCALQLPLTAILPRRLSNATIFSIISTESLPAARWGTARMSRTYSVRLLNF